MLRGVGIIILAFSFFNLSGQKFKVTHFDASRGYNADSSYSIAVDHLNYWWIASDQGLIRYDFDTFQFIDNKKYIKVRVTDRFVIAQNLEELNVFELGPQGQFERVKSITSGEKASKFSLAENGLQSVLFYQGMVLSLPSGQENRLNLGEVRSSTWIGETIYLLLENDSLYSWQEDQQKFVEALPQGIRHITSDGNNLFMVGKQLFKYQLKERKLSQLAFDMRINNVHKVKSDLFVADEFDQLFKLQFQELAIEPKPLYQENDAYRTKPLVMPRINDMAWYGANLMIATTQGLEIASPIQFSNPNPNIPNLYAGSFAPTTNESSHVIVGGQLFQIIHLDEGYQVRELLKNENKFYYASGYGDNLWLGTQEGNILWLQDQKLKKTFQVVDPGNIVFFINRDQIGDVWFCAQQVGGIGKITTTGQIREYDENDGLASRALVLRESEKGELYAGGTSPYAYLFRYDREEDRFINLSLPLDFAYSIRFEIHDLAIGEGDTVWLATTDGLLKYHSNQVERVAINESTPIDTEIRSVVASSAGIWFATDTEGLFQYRPQNSIAFRESSGLVTDIASYRSLGFDQQGNLWVGTVEGYSSSGKGMLTIRQTSTPRIKYNGLQLADSSQVSIAVEKPYSLQILCTGFPPNEILYKYYLSGTDAKRNLLRNGEEAWTVGSYDPSPTIPKLEPGTYTLAVKALQDEGHSWSQPTYLLIEVPLPFWQQPLAYLLYVVALALLIWGLIQVNTIRLNLENKKLERQVRERTESLRTINQKLLQKNDEIDTKNIELHQKSEALIQQIGETRARNKELKHTLKQLRETQYQLVESEKMASLGVLSAGVGHEINNPLNFIKGGISQLSELLKQQEGTIDEEKEQYLNIVNEGVDRAAAIVKSLSHFSRSGQSMEEQCCVEDILDNCLVILENKLKNKVTVKKRYKSKKAIISGNEGQLHQAFLNILSNAEQAIEGDGVISISTVIENGQIVIRVKDNGEGIVQANLNRIMDPFFTTKSPGKGTGLGLSITYKIIEEHKGRIEVFSELNEGTEITITLPV